MRATIPSSLRSLIQFKRTLISIQTHNLKSIDNKKSRKKVCKATVKHSTIINKTITILRAEATQLNSNKTRTKPIHNQERTHRTINHRTTIKKIMEIHILKAIIR